MQLQNIDQRIKEQKDGIKRNIRTEIKSLSGKNKGHEKSRKHITPEFKEQNQEQDPTIEDKRNNLRQALIKKREAEKARENDKDLGR